MFLHPKMVHIVIAIVAMAIATNHGETLSVESRESAALPVAEDGSHPALDAAARQAGANDGWWRAVSADISRWEYEPSATPEGFTAPNRAQNLRTRFGARGIEVEPRTAKSTAPAWRFGWETTGFGRSGSVAEVSPSAPSAAGARVMYQRDGWSEWYENTAKGLEQGFTIDRRPEGDGALQIVGQVPDELTPQPSADGAIDFIDSHGACVIRYGQLRAWDARGIELCANLVPASGGLSIVVDDRDAAYPLTVDPLMTSPAWTGESNQAGAQFGFSVATAGDVNGDGYSDVIVGASTYDIGEDEGRAYVYQGSGSGLSATPAWTAESDLGGSNFGTSVATAGDVNGDGYSDVIVGAPLYTNGQSVEGQAYVYQGSASGLSATPAWTAESDQTNARFGTSVAMAGDVNGDGYADVIVSAHLYDNGEADEGRAYVYQGSASGLGSTPAWTAESNQAVAFFGISVGTAGDVNGDGYGDVVVGGYAYDNGQTNEGRAYVYQGSASGLGSTPAWTAESDQTNALFGTSVATAGDVNGDGYSDIVVGAYAYDNDHTDEGWAYVYQGSGSGLGSTPAWTAESNQAFAAFGISVATAGDVNGDGFSDVIVGAHSYDNPQSDEGRAYFYQGSASGLGSTPAWTAESDQVGANFGISVATAGDVNGDGFSDVIVGAYHYDNGQSNEGRAYVYLGSGSGPGATPAWIAAGNQADAQFGGSVATAGDVNGDGYSDVIVGAPTFDNGQTDEGRAYVYHGSANGLVTTPAWIAESNQASAVFGGSVATAGDVNGDGYSDVIVGAGGYDNGETSEGRAFVYQGAASGLSATPAWTTESNQTGASFGYSVAAAGDVNGDGFSDVIVGALFYSNGQAGEGGAYVYHGSAAGLATLSAWIAESNRAGAFFGNSVAAAGDVNRDGYGDVIVGAYAYENFLYAEGRAFVYLGSAAGLAQVPVWFAGGNQISAFFGNSVATAGDVNGDGFSDVIVGAYGYDNQQFSNCGRAFVYQGSATGLTFIPVWIVEGDYAGTDYGISVATAGDVNCDGFSDIIVGADNYGYPQANNGRASVYQGSAAGLATTPVWIGEGNDEQFGFSVATAGDVNGDGFSDVIIGARAYSNGQSEQGRAFVYYGNGGDGIDRALQQRRADDLAPIDVHGRSDSPNSLRLKSRGRTALGRGNVRLQWEVKPLGVPFDGLGLGSGPVVNTGAPVQGVGSAATLNQVVGSLTGDTPYHWRARVAANNPFFPRTPWFSLPYNNRTEADLRTGVGTSGVEMTETPAASTLIEAARPNPFGSATEIRYVLPRAGKVKLAIYDVMGRQRVVLEDARRTPGEHREGWDGRDASGRALPGGVYFARLAFEGRVEAHKLVLSR